MRFGIVKLIGFSCVARRCSMMRCRVPAPGSCDQSYAWVTVRVGMFSPCLCGFPAVSEMMWSCYAALLLRLNVCLNMCAWCPAMVRHPIQGVFQLHAQCFQDRFRVNLKAVTEGECTWNTIPLFMTGPNYSLYCVPQGSVALEMMINLILITIVITACDFKEGSSKLKPCVSSDFPPG